MTNVLNSKELSHPTASQLYRWRWRNEGLFRTYKRTISGVKFRSRTVAQVHREAEASLLAVQILLAHSVWELRDHGEPEEMRVSPRRVLVLIREDIIMTIGKHLGPKQRQTYAQRLQRLSNAGVFVAAPKLAEYGQDASRISHRNPQRSAG